MSWRYLLTYLHLIMLIITVWYIRVNISFSPIVLNVETIMSLLLLVLFVVTSLVWFLNANSQHRNLKKLQTIKRLERAQILYQIAMIDKDTNVDKLNEWVYSYNQWIIQIESDKQARGYFSYYQPLNMGEHKFIMFV